MRFFTILCCGWLLCSAFILQSQSVSIYGTLSGANEVPAVTTTGMGRIEGIFDPFSRVLAFRVDFSRLTTNVRAAHFHTGAAGANGPVTFDLGPEGFPFGATSGEFVKVVTLSPALAVDLMSGNLYINIHSVQFPGGEVRAQLGYGATPPNRIDVSGNLSGAQEVPAVNTPGTGRFEAIFDPASRGLAFRVDFSGLTSNVAAAHFHIGAAGANGPVTLDFGPLDFPRGARQGSYVRFVTLTEAQSTALQNGNMYINIHTTQFPGGEIRGQLRYNVSPRPRVLPVNGRLEGSQEVPAVATPAAGVVTGVYDPGRQLLAIKMNFSGLTTNTLFAHIHRAAAGANGPIVVDFAGFPVGVTSGTFAILVPLTAALADDLSKGLLYVNIHSTQFRGGELRAQLNAVLPLAPPTVEKTVARTVSASLWPNPATDHLSVALDQRATDAATIELFNAAGHVIQTQITADAQADFEVQALPAGFYFVRVRQSGGQSVYKFVKQ
jgi:CHRD domain/Secretion system C-terminal sorting domain